MWAAPARRDGDNTSEDESNGSAMKYLLLVCMEKPPESALETEEEIASWDVEGEDIKPWLTETVEDGTRLCGSQVSKPATTFSGRCSHSKQITATPAGSGRPCAMQPQANL